MIHFRPERKDTWLLDENPDSEIKDKFKTNTGNIDPTKIFIVPRALSVTFFLLQVGIEHSLVGASTLSYPSPSAYQMFLFN